MVAFILIFVELLTIKSSKWPVQKGYGGLQNLRAAVGDKRWSFG